MTRFPEEDPFDIAAMEEMTAPSAEETEPFETDEFAATPPPHPAKHVNSMISIVPLKYLHQNGLMQRRHLLPIHYHYHYPSYSPTPDRCTIIMTPTFALTLTDLERNDLSHLTSSKSGRSARGPAYRLERARLLLAAKTQLEVLRPQTMAMQGTPVVTDVTKLSQRMTEFETRVRRDTNEVYTRLDDSLSGRKQQAIGCQLNFCLGYGYAQAQLALFPPAAHIRELQSADRRRQTVITEMLTADHKRQKQLTEKLKLIKRL
ncbi:hypothetical protein Tco_0109714 [Tanacetum coccineum]